MPRESLDKRAERIAGFCAVACLAVSALLLGQPYFSNASLPVRGITDPVIAIQAARSIPDVDYVLGESPGPDREVMRMKERIGFVFIAAYTALFLTLALLLLRSGGIGRALAPAAAVCAVAAAAFNVASNLAVLRILDLHLYETTAAMINQIRSAALAAWALVAFALLLLSAYFLRSPRWLPRITGGLFLLTALMQLIGLRDGEFLVLASAPAGLALLLITGMTFWPRRRVKSAPAVLLLLLAASSLRAQVKEVRTYRTHEPRDRNVFLGMAVTPSGDVLSLVPKKDGKWRLTRIRNWLEKAPQQQTIEVPVDLSRVRHAYPSMFVRQDGRFAVSVASGSTNVISAIDLASFAVVDTAQQEGVLEFATDRSGRLVSRQVIANQAGTARQVALKFFTIPSFAPDGSCQFQEVLRGTAWTPLDADCGAGLASLVDGLDPPRQKDLPATPNCATLTSPDGTYRAESCNTFHNGFFDRMEVTDQHANIFSAATGALIGTIKETTHDTVNSRFA